MIESENELLTIFYSGTSDSGELYYDIRKELDAMEKNGDIILHVFPRQQNIEEENYFPREIMDAISDSDVVIALLDESGRTSQWVNQEIGYALCLTKKPHLVPITDKKENLNGLVNMNSQNIIDGDKAKVISELKEKIRNIREKKEEEIYEVIIKRKILELKKYIDFEHYKNIKTPLPEGDMRDIDHLNKNLDELTNDEKYMNFYSIKTLKNLENKLIVIRKIAGTDLSNYCDLFQKDVENLIVARMKTLKKLGQSEDV